MRESLACRYFGSMLVRSLAAATLIAGVLPLGGCVVVVGNRSYPTEASSYADGGSRPMIGVTAEEVDRPLAAQLGIDGRRASVVTGVIGNMPAARAGLERYDVVTSIDGVEAASPDDLRRAVRAMRAGDELRLGIIRGGEPTEVTIRFDGARGVAPAFE